MLQVSGYKTPNNSLDFGFAKCVENFNTGMLATAVGTPLYMSP